MHAFRFRISNQYTKKVLIEELKGNKQSKGI